MAAAPRCPRCGGSVRAPGLWSSTWTCVEHGSVAPLHPPVPASGEALRMVAARAQVPLWLPWPLPSSWLVTGVQHAGDDAGGAVATVVACTGPHPLRLPGESHAAELLLVAEQPGVGLGARLAGLDDIDPGGTVASGPPHARLEALGHPCPLWSVPVPQDVAAYVGEAAGIWLWALLWPQRAGALLLEDLTLVDVRDPGHLLDVPVGALSPRLAG